MKQDEMLKQHNIMVLKWFMFYIFNKLNITENLLVLLSHRAS